MQLHVNGTQVTVPTVVTTIRDLMNHFQLKQAFIMVEHNAIILEKQQHASTKLAHGDSVEFVQFVGGG